APGGRDERHRAGRALHELLQVATARQARAATPGAYTAPAPRSQRLDKPVAVLFEGSSFDRLRMTVFDGPALSKQLILRLAQADRLRLAQADRLRLAQADRLRLAQDTHLG